MGYYRRVGSRKWILDGGLRPRFLVPARKLHPSSKLTLDQLALVETLGIGCHAVNRGKHRTDNADAVSGHDIDLHAGFVQGAQHAGVIGAGRTGPSQQQCGSALW